MKCQIGSKRSALNIHKQLSIDSYPFNPMASLRDWPFCILQRWGGLLGQCYQSVSVELGQKTDWRVVCTIKP